MCSRVPSDMSVSESPGRDNVFSLHTVDLLNMSTNSIVGLRTNELDAATHGYDQGIVASQIR